MRSLGRKHEAFDYVWEALGREFNALNCENQFVKPKILDCSVTNVSLAKTN